MSSTLTIVACLQILSLGSTDNNAYERGFEICSAYGYELVEAKFGKENHLLCLKMRDIGILQALLNEVMKLPPVRKAGSTEKTLQETQLFNKCSSPLTSHTSALLLDIDTDDEELNSINSISLANITMAYGFPVADPASGSAEGYVGEDNHFHGVLYLGNRTLHADPYGKDDPSKYFGAFENDNMIAPRRRRHHAQKNDSNTLPYFPYYVEEHKRLPGIAPARICDLLLLADKEFFEKDANSSLKHTVMRMMHAVAQADIIFRNADFNEDGIPDNIGFAVKYILVLTSNDTNTRVFGDMNYPAVEGRTYLMRFARLRRLSEVCLGVAFSGYAFHNRTLGLSFTSLGGGMGGAAGGLCDRRAYGRSFNTLAIAHAITDDKERVPERIAALTLAHEMGHSFGAHHDDNFPNPECEGFLMGSQSSTSENGMNFEFSLCSKRLIAATLSSMSYCLTAENRPYCGNGIVEEGEACDCGLPSTCSLRDPCCTPRAGGALIFEEGTLHKEGCSVAPTAECHPSQGLCCTNKCQHADLTSSGIDCRTQDQECTCAVNSVACKCGLGGRCLPDGTCHAAECALLGLRECECSKLGPGGKLGEANMCGICCKVHSKIGKHAQCVGAELAAKEILKNKATLPYTWPHDDYSGPNVTITACLEDCADIRELRAWQVDGVCISRNTVGVCARTGVCEYAPQTPRSNLYPDVLNIKLMEKQNAMSMKMKPTTLLTISCITCFALYK